MPIPITLPLWYFFYFNFHSKKIIRSHYSKEQTQSHKKEKIDYYVPIDVRCPEHKLNPMNLFCVDEKGI